MQSNFKMKEATNASEAIISILDVMKENPVWLNKVNGTLASLLKCLNYKEQAFLLSKQIDEQIIDLFVKIKTEYYNFKDNTQWNY
jgi:hypothetical protein